MSFDPVSFALGKSGKGFDGKDVVSYLMGQKVGGGGGSLGVDFATDAWDVIRNTSLAGKTAEIYGNQVGATRDITLTDNSVMTVRLSNATNDLYERSNGKGTTGLVVEFVACFPTKGNMNAKNSNDGGWAACEMRTKTMPELYEKLPPEIKAVIETVDVKTANGGLNATAVVVSPDKLFLPAEHETIGVRNYSTQMECDALTRWQYYTANDTTAARRKKVNTTYAKWWLRSPGYYDATNFCAVSANGYASDDYSITMNGISPAFCI